jgi:hypothetical protein
MKCIRRNQWIYVEFRSNFLCLFLFLFPPQRSGGGSFPVGKAVGAWNGHSSPSRSKVTNVSCCISTPLYLFISWHLIKRRDILLWIFIPEGTVDIISHNRHISRILYFIILLHYIVQWVLQVVTVCVQLYCVSCHYLALSCHCLTLNVSAYIAIFRCVGCFYFFMPEGICSYLPHT